MSQLHILQDATGNVIKDGNVGIDYAILSTVPTDGTGGWGRGAIVKDRDGAAGAQVYINEGTVTSCDFNPLVLPGVNLSGLLATADEINSTSDASTREVLAGATLAVTQALHDGRTIRVPAISAITLPAATGSGARYRFVGAVTATAVTITATAAHLFGNAFLISDDSAAVVGFNAAGSTTITMAGSVNGGIKGWIVEIEDVATSILIVRMNTLASGTEETPFS